MVYLFKNHNKYFYEYLNTFLNLKLIFGIFFILGDTYGLKSNEGSF